jgi:hypothetical protein
MKRASWIIAAALIAAVLPVVPAQAWIITQVNPDVQSGEAVAVAVPFDTTARSNVFELDKFFVKDPAGAAIPGPIVLSFTRQAGDKDIIDIIDELILNLQVDQKRIWTDYHMALVVGDPALVARGGVQFINPAAVMAWQQTGGATRLGGLPSSADATQITWDGLPTVPFGGFGDAPLNQLVIRGLSMDASKVAVGETFFLKEWPTVPEPATLALIAIGGVAMMLKRRSR